MSDIQYNITVKGRVQGVWYRDSTRTKANMLGLRGIVRNQPNSSVYIEAVGTKEQLDQLVKWCKIGPEFAIVDDIEIIIAEQAKDYLDFRITR